MKTRTVIPLDGIWQMTMDADNRGKKESWFASEPSPNAVPGTVPAAYSPQQSGVQLERQR